MTDPLEGRCRCGALRYAVVHAFGPVVCCHCSFCRRVHGASFTTVAFVPRGAVSWLQGEEEASLYQTPQGNFRHFCGTCASPLFNVGGSGGLAAVVTSSLRDDRQPEPWAHVNTESMAPWHRIADGRPEFESWPPARKLRALAREHGASWLPEQLLLPES